MSGTDRRHAVLASQYVRIRTAFVTSGRLRQLWLQEKWRALAPYLVLALNGWGRGADGAYIRFDTLAESCGIRHSSNFMEALFTHLGATLIEQLPSRNPHVVHYRLVPGVLAQGDEPYFVMPGRLVTSGLCATLTGSEQFVLWTLAAFARPELWDYVTRIDSQTPECGAWAESLEGSFFPLDYGTEAVRRVGKTTLGEIARVTGMTRSSVQRAVERLEMRANGELVDVCRAPDGFWYHLPEKLWGAPFHQTG